MNKKNLWGIFEDVSFTLCAVLIFALALNWLWGCASAPEVPTPVPSPIETPPKVEKCPNFVTYTMDRVNGALKMPATGKLVLESHLVSVEDELQGFPKSGGENISKHLALSCDKLRKLFPEKQDCFDVYANRYVKVWTPSENGKVGQGSTGSKPPLDCEMWTINMYWKGASKPKPGTKFMIEANGKKVIACAGYETGPSSASYVGGAQGEVFWYLGISNTSQVRMGLIDDQSLPYGPLKCN